MNILRSILSVTAGAVLTGVVLSPNAKADCGGLPHATAKPSSWQMLESPASVRLLSASMVIDDRDDHDGDHDRMEPIVGLWHVKLIAKGNANIPDGTEIDAGYQAWHSDGTEILNSSRPPSSGNFCLGVWAKVGDRQYKLNHFTTAQDPTGDPHKGMSNIREEVKVGPKGNHFSGTFAIQAYDSDANPLYQIVGVITADRLTVDSPETPLF